MGHIEQGQGSSIQMPPSLVSQCGDRSLEPSGYDSQESAESPTAPSYLGQCGRVVHLALHGHPRQGVSIWRPTGMSSLVCDCASYKSRGTACTYPHLFPCVRKWSLRVFYRSVYLCDHLGFVSEWIFIEEHRPVFLCATGPESMENILSFKREGLESCM